jgi:5-methylcytosine-specific restriction endonuclease McrA
MKRGNRFIDIKGQRFGKWFILEFDSIKKGKKAYWKCLCDCGNKKSVSSDSLRRGNTKSCGCIRKNTGNPNYKHGLKGTKEYDNFCCALYRARKLNQTPADANLKKIQLYYTICSYLNEKAVYYHVDHIHPLSKGGLHEANNLQILDAELNLKKSNKCPLSRAEEIRYKGITI